MKLRTKSYIQRKKALRNMFRFTDLKSFLKASFHTSKSVVVKKDIINMIIELEQPHQMAKAS